MRVKWLDSLATVGWIDVEEEFTFVKVESVGYLWRQDREAVVLVGSVQLDEDGDVAAVNGTLTIPASSVESLEDLCQ